MEERKSNESAISEREAMHERRINKVVRTLLTGVFATNKTENEERLSFHPHNNNQEEEQGEQQQRERSHGREENQRWCRKFREHSQFSVFASRFWSVLFSKPWMRGESTTVLGLAKRTGMSLSLQQVCAHRNPHPSDFL